ncbi:MAG: hypothetical protein HND47_20035 [Chloroflexi bacterium]|nr:hypothetical protein [Chloroflexota bacterium]
MRKDGVLYYLLSDHLGSTSIVTDASGIVVSQTKYKAWGEVRYSSGATPTQYTYTGQYSYTADFGLMFYNARWYDPSLKRFAQADSIVPPGVQGLDRYAYVNNSPIQNTDPTGYFSPEEIKKYLKNKYGDNCEKFWDAWQDDKLFWGMLLAAGIGDDLHAPTSLLGQGTFISCDTGPFCFQSDEGHDLYEYQGKGPYILERNGLPIHTSPLEYTGDTTYTSGLGSPPFWAQPQYDYSQGYPVPTGMIRVVTYNSPISSPDWTVISETNPIDIILAIGTTFIKQPRWVPIIGYVVLGLNTLSYINKGPMRREWVLDVSYVPDILTD